MTHKLKYTKVKKIEKHFRNLYESLKQRLHKVSHRKLPSYTQHIDFVKNHPYREWYLIFLNNEFLGSFYLTFDNSIGLNLDGSDVVVNKSVLKHILSNFKPLKPIRSVRPGCFYVNVPISNNEIEDIIIDIGGVLTQKSYDFRG